MTPTETTRRHAGRAVAALGVTLILAGPAAAAAVLDKPVYFPETKSYFELIDAPDNLSYRKSGDANWESAEKVARSKVFKGTRGRLAVVKSRKTVDFIRDTFKPDRETWFGLRYFCQYRKLLWVTGDVHSLKAFRHWGKPWKSSTVCSGGAEGVFAPVYFSPVRKGFRWHAHGSAKEWGLILIEYPTGKP